MNIYHIWCDLKPGCTDMDFATSTKQYLDHLKQQGVLHDYRITRRKLGLASTSMGDFHLLLEFRDLTHLDDAFAQVSKRKDPLEALHHAVYSKVQNVAFALYRDFPDPGRADR